MSLILMYVKATSTQAGGIVLVEASPQAIAEFARLGHFVIHKSPQPEVVDEAGE
ncbi:MAG: hypothetical protein ACREBU_08965 [Nitrososphaera sp.]